MASTTSGHLGLWWTFTWTVSRPLADCFAHITAYRSLTLITDGSGCQAARLRSPHWALQEIFRPAEERSCAQPFYLQSLLPSHIKDAQLLARTRRLHACLQSTLDFPVLWVAPTLGHISDLRKTWFQEVGYTFHAANSCGAYQ